MTAKGNVRRWAWWLVGGAVALQFYFVQELLAALALFAVGFAAVTFVVGILYMLQKGWEKAVMRIFGSDHVAGLGLPAGVLRRDGPAAALPTLSQELKT